MAYNEDFTFVDRNVTSGSGDSSYQLFDKYTDLTSAKIHGFPQQALASLRAGYPGHVVAYANISTIPLLAFAAEGYATATLDTETDSIVRLQFWDQPIRRGSTGKLGEARIFAKYNYQWGDEEYILYVIPLYSAQFVLKAIGPSETQQSHSVKIDTLLAKVGQYYHKERKGIYVYDLRWLLDLALYEEVQKASWDKVILDPKMKQELTRISGRFFDSKAVYESLGVPWKRGLIFYGPAGNGKTISLRALMHTLADRKDAVPTLYVKAAPSTYHIGQVFFLARQMSPCLLVLEDIDTIVTSSTRSYFFNEVDGLANNDGILMVASTNHIDQLDPGLSKRPSRFDRKYLFPLPSENERIEYVHFWQKKLKDKPEVEFPNVLVAPIAKITHGFSFAYMQEAFVASLLEMAHRRDDDEDEDEVRGDAALGNLEKYELWTVIKEQVKILRDEMDANSQMTSSEFSPDKLSSVANGYSTNPDNFVDMPTTEDSMFDHHYNNIPYHQRTSTRALGQSQGHLGEPVIQQPFEDLARSSNIRFSMYGTHPMGLFDECQD